MAQRKGNRKRSRVIALNKKESGSNTKMSIICGASNGGAKSWDELRKLYWGRCWNTSQLELMIKAMDRARLGNGELMLHAGEGQLSGRKEPAAFWFGEEVCIFFEIGDGAPKALSMSRYDDYLLELEFDAPSVNEGQYRYRVRASICGERISDELIAFEDVEDGLCSTIQKAISACPAMEIKRVH